MSYVEEGCVKVSLGDSNMIVSPDGSCMDNFTHDTEMAIEIKCPFPPSPGSYKVPVFYTIPKYYVPQILSEMYALGAEELLFVCYSSESTTFMKATFCQKLWDSLSSEIVSVFGPNAIRPKRKSDKVPELSNMIAEYLDSKVQFLGEVLSVKAVNCAGRESSIHNPHCTHTDKSEENSKCMKMPETRIVSLSQYVHKSTNLFQDAYRLNRLRASEF